MAAGVLKSDLIRLPIHDPERVNSEFSVRTARIDRVELLLNPRHEILVARPQALLTMLYRSTDGLSHSDGSINARNAPASPRSQGEFALRGLALTARRPKNKLWATKARISQEVVTRMRVTSGIPEDLSLFVSVLGQGQPVRLGQVRHLFR